MNYCSSLLPTPSCHEYPTAPLLLHGWMCAHDVTSEYSVLCWYMSGIWPTWLEVVYIYFTVHGYHIYIMWYRDIQPCAAGSMWNDSGDPALWQEMYMCAQGDRVLGKGLWSGSASGHRSTSIRRQDYIPECSPRGPLKEAIGPIPTGKAGLLLIKELLKTWSKAKRCPPLKNRGYMSSVHFLA